MRARIFSHSGDIYLSLKKSCSARAHAGDRAHTDIRSLPAPPTHTLSHMRDSAPTYTHILSLSNTPRDPDNLSLSFTHTHTHTHNTHAHIHTQLLVRELVKKVVHLADAIYYLTTAAFGSIRGELCGLPFRELVAKIPQLGACQVQEYLEGGVGGCYKNTTQHIMNPPFVVSESKKCSAACHKGLDALLDIYGCCTATDRNAQAEWWQRVGHPRFRTFLVEWTPTVQELFSSPSASVGEDTCAAAASVNIDCALPKCKHDLGGADPQWQGWMDYPPPCCRMECPGRATKSFPYSCSCICPLGFVGEWCNTTRTHVLAGAPTDRMCSHKECVLYLTLRGHMCWQKCSSQASAPGPSRRRASRTCSSTTSVSSSTGCTKAWR